MRVRLLLQARTNEALLQSKTVHSSETYLREKKPID